MWEKALLELQSKNSENLLLHKSNESTGKHCQNQFFFLMLHISFNNMKSVYSSETARFA